MTQPQPLTFEQFVERDARYDHPTYNNFISFFMTSGIVADIIRNQPHFLRFKNEHSDLEARLTDGIMNLDKSIDTNKAIIPFESDLYQAYLIMHSYGVSDEDLFG